MPNFTELLRQLAVPRPNGSRALAETAGLIDQTLRTGGVSPVREEFFLRPT